MLTHDVLSLPSSGSLPVEMLMSCQVMIGRGKKRKRTFCAGEIISVLIIWNREFQSEIALTELSWMRIYPAFPQKITLFPLKSGLDSAYPCDWKMQPPQEWLRIHSSSVGGTLRGTVGHQILVSSAHIVGTYSEAFRDGLFPSPLPVKGQKVSQGSSHQTYL